MSVSTSVSIRFPRFPCALLCFHWHAFRVWNLREKYAGARFRTCTSPRGARGHDDDGDDDDDVDDDDDDSHDDHDDDHHHEDADDDAADNDDDDHDDVSWATNLSQIHLRNDSHINDEADGE